MEQAHIFIYHSQGIFKIIPQICYYELENQVQLSVQPKKNVRVCLALDIILAVLRRLPILWIFVYLLTGSKKQEKIFSA